MTPYQYQILHWMSQQTQLNILIVDKMKINNIIEVLKHTVSCPLLQKSSQQNK